MLGYVMQRPDRDVVGSLRHRDRFPVPRLRHHHVHQVRPGVHETVHVLGMILVKVGLQDQFQDAFGYVGKVEAVR